MRGDVPAAAFLFTQAFGDRRGMYLYWPSFFEKGRTIAPRMAGKTDGYPRKDRGRRLCVHAVRGGSIPAMRGAFLSPGSFRRARGSPFPSARPVGAVLPGRGPAR